VPIGQTKPHEDEEHGEREQGRARAHARHRDRF
jgi:hypothetical protein